MNNSSTLFWKSQRSNHLAIIQPERVTIITMIRITKMMTSTMSCLIWQLQTLADQLIPKEKEVIHKPQPLQLWIIRENSSISTRTETKKTPGSKRKRWWERSLKKELSTSSRAESPSRIEPRAQPNRLIRITIMITIVIWIQVTTKKLRTIRATEAPQLSTQLKCSLIPNSSKRQSKWLMENLSSLEGIDSTPVTEIEC